MVVSAYQVANSYIRPNVATYLNNLQKAVQSSRLSILRSDGGEQPPLFSTCHSRTEMV